MFVYYIMIKKITENKKKHYKNYRLKNREKINEYQRHYYHTKKNNEIDELKEARRQAEKKAEDEFKITTNSEQSKKEVDEVKKGIVKDVILNSKEIIENQI